jgi:hypothetical protein
VTVRDGGMLRARLLAALLRVRREPNFHRNNDRKSEGGMQGCARCELFGGLGKTEGFSGDVEFWAVLRRLPTSQTAGKLDLRAQILF